MSVETQITKLRMLGIDGIKHNSFGYSYKDGKNHTLVLVHTNGGMERIDLAQYSSVMILDHFIALYRTPWDVSHVITYNPMKDKFSNRLDELKIDGTVRVALVSKNDVYGGLLKGGKLLGITSNGVAYLVNKDGKLINLHSRVHYANASLTLHIIDLEDGTYKVEAAYDSDRTFAKYELCIVDDDLNIIKKL